MLWYIFAIALLCFVLEKLSPGWELPSVKTWAARAVLANLVQLGVMLLAGVTWEAWLSSWSLLDLSAHLSPVQGGLVAYFIGTFVFYWWHRIRHENEFLWRVFHQIHHSPQRIEMITAFYKHPAEMAVNSLIGALLVYALLGLSAEAGAIYTACAALAEILYHTNVRTPQWIGYFFKRPEMHRIHQQYRRHRNNYGDVVCWDILFGTYENPEEVACQCGFDDPREQRLRDMLLCKDVHASTK